MFSFYERKKVRNIQFKKHIHFLMYLFIQPQIGSQSPRGVEGIQNWFSPDPILGINIKLYSSSNLSIWGKSSVDTIRPKKEKVNIYFNGFEIYIYINILQMLSIFIYIQHIPENCDISFFNFLTPHHRNSTHLMLERTSKKKPP
jgi:hypothetical protein